MVTVNLVAGNLALDFANTAGGRGTIAPVEHLARPDDLAAWAVQAQIVARPPCVTPALLRRAIGLREAIHRIGAAIAGGNSPPTADLARCEKPLATPWPRRDWRRRRMATGAWISPRRRPRRCCWGRWRGRRSSCWPAARSTG